MTKQPADFARSDNPVLDRLLKAAGHQHVAGVDLTLNRLQRLLTRMTSPHRKLPPVFHVAGTNGKGSTVAFLRAALEASGHRVHVFTSPHLVRVNERIRVAGQLVSDEDLIEALVEVLRYSGGQPISFFEVMTAAAFLLFAAEPADACILEVGLGGRLDATNVVEEPLVTGITQLGLDHIAILGPTMRHIATEKAGIAKRGVPLVTQKYPSAVAAAVAETALMKGAILKARGETWDAALYEGQIAFRDFAEPDKQPLRLPLPKLPGSHQVDNAALAVAMLKVQDRLLVPDGALRSAMGWAQWPGRLQRLSAGALFDCLPPGSELWLDGGHNPSAGRAVAGFLSEASTALPTRMVIGMLGTKDHAAFIRAFPLGMSMCFVRIPGHESSDPDMLAAIARTSGHVAETAPSLEEALGRIDSPSRTMILGSLHLVGAALKANGTIPA